MGEFERYRATLSDYELLRSANCCRHAFEHQQSKIEQLEKEKAELQGRIRKATSKWIVVTSIATTQESGLPDTFYQKLEELRDALVGFKEATRGECEQ